MGGNARAGSSPALGTLTQGFIAAPLREPFCILGMVSQKCRKILHLVTMVDRELGKNFGVKKPNSNTFMCRRSGVVSVLGSSLSDRWFFHSVNWWSIKMKPRCKSGRRGSIAYQKFSTRSCEV